MKKNIHPNYEKATVKCACGNSFETRSTEKEIHVELCSACHPFFTGKQKLIDTAGRVDKFEARRKKAAEIGTVKSKEKKVKNEVTETDLQKIKEELEAETIEITEEKPSDESANEVAEDRTDEQTDEATPEQA